MAVLVMANDDGKPVFHDFFGSGCANFPVLVKGGIEDIGTEGSSPSASARAPSGAHVPVSTSSELVSERQAGSSSDGFQFCDPNSNIHEARNIFSGKKRSNSDSTFVGSETDRKAKASPGPLRGSHVLKVFKHEIGSEEHNKPYEVETFFGVQRPGPICTLTPHAPAVRRPDLTLSNWDWPVATSSGPMLHYPSRLSQFVDKRSVSQSKDHTSATLISQYAADEGSRTGIKGSDIIKVINASAGALDKHPTRFLPGSSRSNAGSKTTETKSDSPCCRSLTSSRQMTIFYAGQAHVFDDVHPNKAEAIMALAGSNGGSWSTTLSRKASGQEYVSCAEKDVKVKTNSVSLGQDLIGKLPVPGCSSHILGQDARISPSNSGLRHSGKAVRDVRDVGRTRDPDIEGKNI